MFCTYLGGGLFHRGSFLFVNLLPCVAMRDLDAVKTSFRSSIHRVGQFLLGEVGVFQ